MIIGSHNSFSYLPSKHWWMRPFRFMARCQRVGYIKQYNDYGVRVFDLRVWFDEDGTLCLRHGKMTFDTRRTLDIFFIIDAMNFFDKKGDCYVRIILEEDNTLKYKYYSDIAEEQFKRLCEDLKSGFPNIRFFGGNRKFDWKQLYDLGNDVQLDDKYSSTTSLFRSKKRWLAKLDDLWPWLYAGLHNKKNFERGTDKQCLFMDFVDIR